MTTATKKADSEFLYSKLEGLTYEFNLKLVSEWAQEKRVLPSSVTSLPGPWDNAVAPYLVEIMDCMSETSPVREVAVMKSSQVGFTTGVIENALGYIVDHTPGPTMFVAGDKNMAEQSVELRIDKMLESAGIRDKIFAQTTKAHTRKTGDTKGKKEFPGGFLLAVGPNSPSKLRSVSIKYLLFDEVDAYPATSGKEGDPIALAKKRTDAFETVRKIAYISTPLFEASSIIRQVYDKGDQRKFFVPCLHCETYQILEWANIRYEKDSHGNLIYDSVCYECPHCKETFKNSDKPLFMEKGEWRPTAISKDPGLRSYHINALYSPAGMKSWEACCQEWIEAQGDPLKLQVFTNTVLGECWVERGQSPSYEKVLSHRGDYRRGTIPSDVLVLTAGVDIQKDRIEVELTGWADKKVSFSIDYHIFHSEYEDVEQDPNDSCWRELDEFIRFTRKTEDGRELNIMVAFIDSSYATNTVYQFCENYSSGVYAIQGFSANSPKKGKAVIRRDVSGYEISRYDLVTDIFKDEIAACLRKEPPAAGDKYPTGFCHFPSDYNETYFKQLTAEERFLKKDSKGNTFYAWENKKRRRNEALDCRVYSLAALYLLFEFISADYETGTFAWADFWQVIKGEN